MGGSVSREVDKAWSIKHEGKLNKNNIIFQDDKFLKVYLKMKEIDDRVKQITDIYGIKEKDWKSDCCTSPPFGNQFQEEEETGICSKCFDGANFSDLNNDKGESKW